MDKISKALQKLNPKERNQIRIILIKLRAGNLKGLDLKKLRGREDIFRIRTGNIRIIYRPYNKQVNILAIERRNDNTYNY